MAKLANPLKASSSLKRPSPRHPKVVVTIPAFFPEVELVTSDPGVTFSSTSEIDEGSE